MGSLVQLLAVLAIASLAQATFFHALHDSNILTVGRSEERDGGLAFDMPGFEVRVRVTGTTGANISLAAFQSSGFQPNGFVVTINGAVVPSANQSVSNFTFFTSQQMPNLTATPFPLHDAPLDPSQQYDIRIVKASEAQWNARTVMPNYIVLHGIELDHGGKLLPPPAIPQRRIEFLGDSITAGFCNMCENPGLSNVFSENHFYGWPRGICELTNAACHTAAWSGFGMVENCCGGTTVMSEVYLRTLATVASSQWSFPSWKPDAVVWNLGTNDHLSGRPTLVGNYTTVYTDLLLSTAQAYGDKTSFFLAVGPMATDYLQEVDWVIGNVTAKGVKNVYFLDQRGFLNGTFGPSCCGHPSAQVDVAMAQHGAAFISSKLGW